MVIFASGASWRRLRDMSSGHLRGVLGGAGLLRWGRVGDVFKACLEGVFKASWGRADVCWGRILCLHGDAMVIFLFYSFLGVFAAPISFSFCF